ncbi:MAG: condensation domain-containing protein, partial [Polyangiaceae bacterium]
MTASNLLAELRALDVRLHVEGGRLRVNAPKGRMTPALEAALVAAKEDLLRELESGNHPDVLPALLPIPRNAATLPLSFFQERLWVLDRLQPGLTTYNFGSLFTPPGPIDIERLTVTLRRVVARHEILRARFILEDEAPVARLAPAEATPIVVSDLRGESEQVRQSMLDGASAEAVNVPFNLETDAPVRFRIFRTADDRASLLISAHHIALDAWSFALIVRDIQTEYLALSDGRPEGPPPSLQYADFAHWQRSVSAHPSGIARLAYWKKHLAALPSLSVFPRDHAGTADAGKGATLDFEWPPELYAAVRTLARESGATLYMVLLAAVAAVLHRHTGQSDLALGSPLGTRDQQALEGMVGPIVSPLVLRFDLSDDPSFRQLIARAREELLEGHANQEVPFERVVRELNPERLLNSSPLFQTAVVLHNAPDASLVRITSGGAVYDLTLFATERNGTLQGSFEYRTDVYEPATVARIASHVRTLLEGAARASDCRISELPLIDEEERKLLTEGFNPRPTEVERATVIAQFARVAAERREEVAIVASDRSLTYGALDRLSDQLAARLSANGAGPGRFVALATDRTSALAVAMLAILKVGAAYVPIDPTYPAERVAFMLKDSGAEQMLTTRAALKTAALRDTTATRIVVDELPDETLGTSGTALSSPSPEHVAYLIYTSGSTGTPKGVLVPHSALSNFLAGMRECVGFRESDAVLAVTSPSFDISVLELLLPLVQGGRVVIADREDITDGARLARLLKSSGATLLQSTPSAWRPLMNVGWEGDPQLTAIVGGEPLPAALA